MKKINILLVEDNVADVVLIEEGLKQTQHDVDLDTVEDVSEALYYLQYKTPDLILLDINLPKVNGLDLLENIRKNDKQKHIPVVVLTASNSQQLILEAYQKQANSYMIKPLDIECFLDFWTNHAELPN